MDFEIVALVCALSVSPQDCTFEKGARIVEKIGEERSELGCLRQGALSAGGAVSKPRDDEYLKIVCRRRGVHTLAHGTPSRDNSQSRVAIQANGSR